MSLNINIGGEKSKDQLVNRSFKTVDIAPDADYQVNLNENGLPFNGCQVSNIYTSHTLEHILPCRQEFVWYEMHRVLEDGGRLRIVVPDARAACEAYLRDDLDWFRNGGPSKLDEMPPNALGFLCGVFFTYKGERNVKKLPLGGHVMAFDEPMINWYLERAGFQKYNKFDYNVGTPVFQGLDLPRYQGNSLFIEAVK